MAGRRRRRQKQEYERLVIFIFGLMALGGFVLLVAIADHFPA